MIFAHSWMAGVWAFLGMSVAVSWFQNRELRRRWKAQEEKLQETQKKVEEVEEQAIQENGV